MILDPTWSLNRVVIVDLPGFDLPDDVKGQPMYQLLSSLALTWLVRQHVGALRLDPRLDDHSLRLAFDRSLQGDDPAVRSVASAIAHKLGDNLGYLLLALKRGDVVNRQARQEWSFTQWDHWAGIERVWLGGGLVSGNLGPLMVHHANAVLAAGGFHELQVRLASRPADLPLLGAARYAAPGSEAAAVLDFGSSRVKRGWVLFRGGQVAELHKLPDLTVPWATPNGAAATGPEKARALLDSMGATLVDTWSRARAQGIDPAPIIPVSVAAYVRDGNPMPAQAGVYTQMLLVTDNLEEALGQRLRAHLDKRLRVKLFHDGTAAAMVYAGQERTAVIMLGTALGIGFPPA